MPDKVPILGNDCRTLLGADRIQGMLATVKSRIFVSRVDLEM
jgi:hypothetical protein